MVKAASVARWTAKFVACGLPVALFVQVRVTLPAGAASCATEVRVGAAGETAYLTGRIMSFSSCPSRWQCQTYSQPKFVTALVTVMALPVVGSNVLMTAFVGSVGSIGRQLSPSLNGSFGVEGRIAMITSSSGFIRRVSFQPSSFGSGGLIAPSQPARLTSWTSIRWKWMAWVSTPLWVIFHNCVPSLVLPTGVPMSEGLNTSVTGSAYPIGIVVWTFALVLGSSTPKVAFIRP